MQMKCKVNLGDKVVYLKRMHCKLGEIVTWEVLNDTKTVRVGIIRQMNDPYLIKRIGWQKFPLKYWLGSRFYTQKIFVAPTRKELIIKMLEIK